jgi:hypothetical protein
MLQSALGDRKMHFANGSNIAAPQEIFVVAWFDAVDGSSTGT